MNIILYIIIFTMGTLFGSFYTLAIYRIPKRQDITHTHSYCPNCNHKLGFFELIPIWSYIFLGGKCKNCKQKIRPRYLILEILSGLTFVLLALSLKIDIYNFNIDVIIKFAFLVLYLVAIFLIAGIDKEKRHIEKSVIYYALGILAIYIIYLCIIDNISMYRYVMYLSAIIILLIIDTILLINKAKESYFISTLMLVIIMAIFTGEGVTILTLIYALLVLVTDILIEKIKEKSNKNKKEHKDTNLPIGFLLGISNVIVLIMVMFINNWFIK